MWQSPPSPPTLLSSRWQGLVAVLCLLVGCASLPPRPAEAPSYALRDEAATRLGRVAAASLGPEAESAFQLLPVASAAMQARLALAQSAERTLDAQYFVWNGDATGRYLLDSCAGPPNAAFGYGC